MANIVLVSNILLLFHLPKGLWNKSAKYKKLRKYWSYCTRNRAITNAYLLGRKQRTKTKLSFSTWSKIEYGVLRGFILGPLLFNINILDMFFEQKDVNFAAYADHNTRYCFDKNLEVLHSKFQICALKPLEWFSNNYMQMNSDKWHLILVLMMKVSK